MRRPHRVVLLTSAAALAGAALSACGIPTDNSPRAVPGLPTTTTTSTTAAKSEVAAYLYWVFDGTAIERVEVTVPTGSSLTRIIDTLLDGPTTPKILDTQLGSYLTNVKRLHTSQTKSVVTVNLSGNFSTISGQEEVLAVAQIVYTVASFNPPAGETVNPTVKVLFQVDGSPVAVPEGTGASTTAPVTIGSYARLVVTRGAT